MRHAVSLLEVLVSIFVLAVGLLSLAALIPAGRFCIVETAKADRSAACGRAVLRDIQIRGWLDREKWSPATDDAVVFLDPIGASDARFPSCAATYSVPRVSLADVPPELAKRLCVWEDDIVFDMPEDRDERPSLLLADNGVQPTAGNYSWAAMISTTDDPELWKVSIVVFYKRTLGERIATATMHGLSEIELSPPEELREQTWLALTDGKRWTWYRAVHSIGDRTTIAGPDWLTELKDIDGDGIKQELQAVICDEVVGVYSQVIRSE